MSPNRLVVILTPLVFAPLAGAVTAWVAQHVPGVPALDNTQLTALFVAGATIAFGKAALWLHGWQQFAQSPDGQVGTTAAAPAAAPAPLHPEGDYAPDLAFEAQPVLNGDGQLAPAPA